MDGILGVVILITLIVTHSPVDIMAIVIMVAVITVEGMAIMVTTTTAITTTLITTTTTTIAIIIQIIKVCITARVTTLL